MQAIETDYRCYRFRSRLEARWAYYFDLIQFPWEYEPEGFALHDGAYLPDFRLFGRMWAEVKRLGLGALERQRAERLAIQLSDIALKPVVVFYGDPLDVLDLGRCFVADKGAGRPGAALRFVSSPEPYQWEAAHMARRIRFEHGETPGKPDGLATPYFDAEAARATARFDRETPYW